MAGNLTPIRLGVLGLSGGPSKSSPSPMICTSINWNEKEYLRPPPLPNKIHRASVSTAFNSLKS